VPLETTVLHLANDAALASALPHVAERYVFFLLVPGLLFNGPHCYLFSLSYELPGVHTSAGCLTLANCYFPKFPITPRLPGPNSLQAERLSTSSETIRDKLVTKI
jgi:hypothetical protein